MLRKVYIKQPFLRWHFDFIKDGEASFKFKYMSKVGSTHELEQILW